MNWKEMNLKAVLIIANKQVEIETVSKNFGTIYKVGDEDKFYYVRLLTQNGFNKLFCDCKNVSLFPESMCSHKIAIIMFSQMEVFK